MICIFLSACGGKLFPKPAATPTFTSTHTYQPTSTSTAISLPTRTAIPYPPPLEYFIDKNSFEMVLIPAGEFLMGNDSIGGKRPVHKVYLENYYIDKDAVKNTDFVRFLNENLEDISVRIRDGIIYDSPSKTEGIENYGTEVYLHEDLIYCIDCLGWDSDDPSEEDWDKSIIWDNKSFSVLDGREDFPVTMVNWFGAQAYCKWRGGQLPTEAEWIKAYNNSMERNDLVSEWVSDWFADDYYSHSPYKNPQGPETGKFRLIIGSSPYPDYMSPSFGLWDIGFRCSRDSLD